MAYPARSVNYVYTRKGMVMVNVGDDIRMDVERLPRQDLRRVCAFLGLGGDAKKSNEQLLDDILNHVLDPSNVVGGGMVLRKDDSRGWLDLTKFIEDTMVRVMEEKGLV